MDRRVGRRRLAREKRRRVAVRFCGESVEVDGERDETYGLSGIVKDVEGDDAEEVEAEDKEDRKEEVPLEDAEVMFGYDSCHVPVLDYHNFGLGFLCQELRGGNFRLGWPSTLYPECYGHNREVDSNQHGAW